MSTTEAQQTSDLEWLPPDQRPGFYSDAYYNTPTYQTNQQLQSEQDWERINAQYRDATTQDALIGQQYGTIDVGADREFAARMSGRPTLPYDIPESAYEYVNRYYNPNRKWSDYATVNPFILDMTTRRAPDIGGPHPKPIDALHRQDYGGIQGRDFRANEKWGLDIKRQETGIQDHWRESTDRSGSGRTDILDWSGSGPQAQQREFNRVLLEGPVDYNYYNTNPRYMDLGRAARDRYAEPGLFGEDWFGYSNVQEIRYINQFIEGGGAPQTKGGFSVEEFKANKVAQNKIDAWDRWMSAQPSYLTGDDAIQALGGVTQSDVVRLSDQFRDSLVGYQQLWDQTFTGAYADWRSSQEQALEEQRTGFRTDLQRQSDVYMSRLGALSDEISGYVGDIDDLQGSLQLSADNISSLESSLALSNAARESLNYRVKEYQEMQIKNQERARMAAAYGASGKPLNPSVTGVKTVATRELGGGRLQGPSGSFNREGMRISNLNI